MTNAALVTGASAGLGTGFARGLAAQGHDLILTARRTDRLETLAAELRDKHGITVTVIAGDLAIPGAAETLIADIAGRGLTIDTLVNNAGFGLQGGFADQERAALTGMLDCNCRALMELTHLVLPGMIERRSGGILNVASIAAFQPGPWMAVYFATKAFVLSFSEALHEEVKPHGVRVAALCPGPTVTEFADKAGMGQSALFEKFASPMDGVVRDGLKALADNRAVAISGTMNKGIVFSTRLTPRGILRRMTASLQKTRVK